MHGLVSREGVMLMLMMSGLGVKSTIMEWVSPIMTVLSFESGFLTNCKAPDSLVVGAEQARHPAERRLGRRLCNKLDVEERGSLKEANDLDNNNSKKTTFIASTHLVSPGTVSATECSKWGRFFDIQGLVPAESRLHPVPVTRCPPRWSLSG